MIKNSHDQKGSAHIVIIITLVVAILGALGFVFWQNYMNKGSADAAQKQTEVSHSSEKVKDSNEGYLVLKDWGVKFKLAESLQSTEVKYYARSTNDNPSRAYYAFTTARIQALGGKCVEQTFGDTASLIRDTEKPIATPDGELVNSTAINGYYYTLTSPIASCSGFDQNGQMQSPSQIEIDDRAALKASIKGLIISE